MNDNKNMTTQNLWHTAKAILRGKFTAIQSYLKKQEQQKNNLSLTPKATKERRGATTTTKNQS